MESTSSTKRVRGDRSAAAPLAALSGAFACGIAAQTVVEASALAFCAGMVLFATFAITTRSSRFAAFFVSAAFFFGGGLCSSSRGGPPPVNSIRNLIGTGEVGSGDPLELEGTVLRTPELTPTGLVLDLKVKKLEYKAKLSEATGTVRVYLLARNSSSFEEMEALKIVEGRVLRCAGLIDREEKFRNPGGFSYVSMLDLQGVDAVLKVKSPLLIEAVGGLPAATVTRRLGELRTSILRSALRLFDQPAAGIIAASMLGNRHFLAKDPAEVYRSGGTFHLLVISGLHVTFVGAVALWLASAVFSGRLARLSISCGCVWFFALLSGSGIPVVRAALMFTLIAVSVLLFRKGSGLNALGLCVLILLAADPHSVFDPSFQLSVLSVAAITGAAFPLLERCRETGQWYPRPAAPFPPRVPSSFRRFCEVLYWSEAAWEFRLRGNVWDCRLFKSRAARKIGGTFVQKIVRTAFEGTLVSLTVQAFLLPLMIVYFHRITPSGAAVNLVAAPMMVVQSCLALVSIVFGSFTETIGGSFAVLTGCFVDLSVALQSLISRSLSGSFRVPVYTGPYSVIYVFFYLPLIYLAARLNSGKPSSTVPARPRRLNRVADLAAAAAFTVLAIVAVFHPSSRPAPDGKLKADFLDVGQGDSILVTFPDGRTMLVDGGGRRSLDLSGEGNSDDFEPDIRGIGESVVSEFLWERGYSSIDFVVATHTDADHIGGLTEAARNFQVSEAMFGSGIPEDEGFRMLAAVLEEENIPVRMLSAGDKFVVGGVEIDVLNPAADVAARPPGDNDSSVVLRITYGVRSFLLTGDIEIAAEREITARSNPVRSDIVKVPHHGSRTSSGEGFVRSVAPEIAIISVGRRSQFGHPHKEVVGRWLRNGASVYSTGRSGMISISTNGSDLVLETFVK